MHTVGGHLGVRKGVWPERHQHHQQHQLIIIVIVIIRQTPPLLQSHVVYVAIVAAVCDTKMMIGFVLIVQGTR